MDHIRRNKKRLFSLDKKLELKLRLAAKSGNVQASPGSVHFKVFDSAKSDDLGSLIHRMRALGS
jgi:hypothetical protein